MSTSGGITSTSPIAVATAHLDAASIDTMHSAPTQIVAAPGAGKALIAVGGAAEFRAGIVGFSTALTPSIYWGSAPSAAAQAYPLFGTPLVGNNGPPVDQFSGGLSPAIASGSGNTSIDPAIADNQPLTVGLASAGPNRAGPIATMTIANGGAGYVLNDTGTIDVDQYIGGATYRVSAVGALGVVIGLVLTGVGDGYTLVDNPLTTTPGGAQPGVGVGLTVNVTVLVNTDGNLWVTVLYRTVTLH